MALTQKPRERTRAWPTTVAVLVLLVALLVLPLALAPRAEALHLLDDGDSSRPRRGLSTG